MLTLCIALPSTTAVNLPGIRPLPKRLNQKPTLRIRIHPGSVLNEYFNGLLRQYIPKGADLRQITDEDITQIQEKLNLRPRKCLGYRQPKHVFEELRQTA